MTRPVFGSKTARNTIRAWRAFMAELTPFHIAFAVSDLAAARDFYGRALGCPEGRSSDRWIDFDLFGHQIVAHLKPGVEARLHHNAVDGDEAPAPHFGVVLPMTAWETLAARLKAVGVAFVIEPHVRSRGQIGEQATMFFLDPCGNALEFKAFADLSQLFAK
jgi:extradiol dioxygenase family protein